jgi:hypothetical protein
MVFSGSLANVPGAVGVVHYVAVERGDAHADMGRSKGAYDDPPLLGAETERPGRAAAGGSSEFSLAEETDRDGLVHALADDTPAQSGDLADFGAGGCLARPHQVDDPQQARHFVRLCSKAEGRVCRHGNNSHTREPTNARFCMTIAKTFRTYE